MKARWHWVGFGYALLALIGGVLGLRAHGTNPFWHPAPLLHVAPWAREILSCASGAAFAVVVIVLTRVLVARAAWSRRLHEELRPVAVGLSTSGIAMIATLSSLGEELFFRGFLAPWVGVVAQGVLFGAAHQLRGPSRWWWMSWAALAGLALGALHWVLGSLSGPIVAHALINGVNLVYLRDHDPTKRPSRLGGLLRT